MVTDAVSDTELFPAVPADTYPAELSLKKDHIVFDAVYNRITPLVEQAQRSGCTILKGLDMLIGQGAESFKLWFGTDASTDAMRKVLE